MKFGAAADNEDARKQVHAWFAGKDGWKPKHKVCEEFIQRISGKDPEFAGVGAFSLAFPIRRPSQPKNSDALTSGRLLRTLTEDETLEMLRPKVADYVTSIASLIFAPRSTRQVDTRRL